MEVFELNHNIWPAFSDGVHKFRNQSVVFRSGNTFLAKAHVKRIVQKFFVVRTHIDADRKCLLGVNTCAGSVESQLTDRNTHTVNAQVT